MEEMRAQLATLNEKLENESIVDKTHVNEATKKHLSELQRKLIGRIILITAWAVFFYWKLELGIFLFLCLGLLVISVYLYWVVRKGDFASMPVTVYAQRIRKAWKIYNKASLFVWILSVLLILAWGTYVLIINWPANKVAAFIVFSTCCLIAIIVFVSYYIGYVCVPSDVEIMLEQVLEDLGKDDQDA